MKRVASGLLLLSIVSTSQAINIRSEPRTASDLIREATTVASSELQKSTSKTLSDPLVENWANKQAEQATEKAENALEKLHQTMAMLLNLFLH